MCVIVAILYKKNILFLRRMFRYNLLVTTNLSNVIGWKKKTVIKIGAKELEIMSFNSIYTSCRSISSIRSRSNGLHDGWPGTYDATTTRWSRFSSRLCTLPSRILWTSFVINSIIVIIKVNSNYFKFFFSITRSVIDAFRPLDILNFCMNLSDLTWKDFS